ncbi:MAG: SprB repeat-containing protein [Flavobacteriales bacterium]|jgi:hypothetical protein|nr:SprB repeat-containing protein [Flavobacteriales bacterium]
MKKLFWLLFVFTLYASYSFAEYDVKWANVSGYSYSHTANTLQKTAGSNWNYAVFSHNKLESQHNGEVKFTVTNTGHSFFIGLVNSTTPGNYEKLQFAANQNHTDLRIFEYGDLKDTYSGVIGVGDVVMVERSGANILYSVISSGVKTTYHTTPVNINDQLYAGACSYYHGSVLANVKSSFGYIGCVASLTHIDPENNVLSGSINVTSIDAQGGYYTLSWDNGAMGNSISGLQPGTYTLTITDGIGGVEERVFKIGYLNKWLNVTGYTYSSVNNSIAKLTGGNSWNDGVGISANQLKANENGSVKYAVESITDNKLRVFGLTTYNLAGGIGSIKYGLGTYNGDVFVYESGSFNHARNGVLAIGDELEIHRYNGTVYYNRIRNGKKWTFYETAANVFMSEDLFVDVNFYYPGVSLNNVVTTFDIPIDLSATVTHIDLDNNVQGQVDLQVTGTSGPYTYLWSNGATTQDINNVTQDTYSVVVTDIFNNTKSQTFGVDYMVKWDNVSGIAVDGVNNILTKTAPFGWTNAGAVSHNYLKSGEPGVVTYKVDGIDYYRFLGFWDEDIANVNEPVNSYKNFDYCMYQRYNRIHIIENGNWIGQYNFISPGDIFYLERDVQNNKINYRFKDVSTGGEYLLRSVTPPNSNKLYVGTAMTQTGLQVSKVRATFTYSNGTSYAELYPKLNGGYYKVEDKKLRFHYVEEYQDLDGVLNYKVYPTGSNTPLTLPAQSVVYGNNFYEIDLSTIPIQVPLYYILEVTNEKQEKQYLRFFYDGNPIFDPQHPCPGCPTE